MTSRIKKKYKAQVTFVALNGSMGPTQVLECEIGGCKKLDGPDYLDDLLKDVYEQIHPDVGITDCRCSVAGIYSSGTYLHYSCQVRVASEDGQIMSDSVEVFVDRTTIEEVT